MDAKYFKDQICDELKGAKCYIKKAIELKPMAPAWTKMLVEMSGAELRHAEYLNKMFGEYYQQMANTYKTVPQYIQDIYAEVTDMYTEEVAKIKLMHEMINQ